MWPATGRVGGDRPKAHAAGLSRLELLVAVSQRSGAARHPGGAGGYQSIDELIEPGGRLHEQRGIAWEKLNSIPGVSCVRPMGALYVFPKLDPNVYEIHDDRQFALDLLERERILITQGTGFNWPNPDHFRIVTLPPPGTWDRDRADREPQLVPAVAGACRAPGSP